MNEIKHIPGDRRADPVIRDSDGDWTPAPFWMQACTYACAAVLLFGAAFVVGFAIGGV